MHSLRLNMAHLAWVIQDSSGHASWSVNPDIGTDEASIRFKILMDINELILSCREEDIPLEPAQRVSQPQSCLRPPVMGARLRSRCGRTWYICTWLWYHECSSRQRRYPTRLPWTHLLSRSRKHHPGCGVLWKRCPHDALSNRLCRPRGRCPPGVLRVSPTNLGRAFGVSV